MLRCWKCRKYVANSDCLIKCHGKQQCEFSTAAQNTCNVWHMNLEDLPDWVKCAIEKAQWTIGKLNCPFCGTRLGGFNFVRNTKCSCEDDDTGQENITPVDQEPASISLVTVHQKKLSKRERNKLKSLRRKQRRRERWLQKQISNDNVNTDDEHEHRGDKESFLCAVCLDVYFNPYMCYPCRHIFCEPCLRMLAKDNPTSTPCPLCRTIIARVFFQSELNNSTKSFFPSEYLKLKENFQKSSSAKWPLPSCRKAFRVFEGFQRHADPVARRHFPHAAHRMDYMDFEDDSRGWRFDMDMADVEVLNKQQ
ncbi:E3 ubiquitin-protein ligase RNF180 isoform A [Alligator mississippiensis]|uniref:E3 ubiquitin-protein ligase RNF180 n=1 Tax=Alligator mississippiensis TaxID=8496 RepID=A0A151MX88_ALLMI|nr:E3 ubiquitin-protein ligase RNF180 isoform A [Alligator mississippiensis]